MIIWQINQRGEGQMYRKKEVINYLNESGIEYEIAEHTAVYTVEEAEALNLPHPEAGTKNLFLRDDKKRKYYLVVARDNAPINLKELRTKLESRPLTFASEKDLAEILGLLPGSVTPLGILNDNERRVEVILDAALCGRLIAMHPNENTATVWMQEEDISRIIDEHGNAKRTVELC